MRLALVLGILAAEFLALVEGAFARELSKASADGSRNTMPNTGIVLQQLAIQTGRLVATGSAFKPRTVVVLDGVHRTTSDAAGAFRFSLLYLPADCIVELKVGLKADRAVVGSCGSKGINFVGDWSAAEQYDVDDAVTLDGFPPFLRTRVLFPLRVRWKRD